MRPSRDTFIIQARIHKKKLQNEAWRLNNFKPGASEDPEQFENFSLNTGYKMKGKGNGGNGPGKGNPPPLPVLEETDERETTFPATRETREHLSSQPYHWYDCDWAAEEKEENSDTPLANWDEHEHGLPDWGASSENFGLQYLAV